MAKIHGVAANFSWLASLSLMIHHQAAVGDITSAKFRFYPLE